MRVERKVKVGEIARSILDTFPQIQFFERAAAIGEAVPDRHHGGDQHTHPAEERLEPVAIRPMPRRQHGKQIGHADDADREEAPERDLADLHLNYEDVDPWPDLRVRFAPGFDPDDSAAWRVERMRYAKVTDPKTRKKVDDRTTVKLTLGQYLASIRNDRRMTLREVEEATNKQVSNAYLSQIENDKIQKPSPNVLHTLAELYGISFEKLMEMAGYLMPAGKRADGDRHGRVATFAEHNLTPEEEIELMDYLQFIRSRKRPVDKT